MPTNPDSLSVRVVQVDAPSDKPWDEPIDVETEGFKAAVVFLVESGNNDKLVALWRDGNNLRLRDPNNPGAGRTLSELVSDISLDDRKWRHHFLVMGA